MHRAAGGAGFGTSDHNAVGHNQRNKNAQRLIQTERVGVDQHLHGTDHRGDNQHVNRDADFIRDPLTECGNHGVGTGQHQRGRQP
ncbi:hypothetical protein SRABI106_03405 [Rahnella aquatilis]|nr:hypothetical protein SRABI106_03405 [Rahnella aquatilis]